ncbi:MAG: DUF4340 domain-containing protein, partial [Proteobacteria bacterium]|nr:DUF4340 domain-containing protein [Pseudomonadota bacterium]
MSLRKTLLLTALLGALLLYIAKVELPKDEQKRVAERPLEKVIGASFEEITISSVKGVFTLLNATPRNGGAADETEENTLSEVESAQWSIKGIKDSHLDRAALNAMVSAIRALALENPLPAEETDSDLSVYGLAKPELRIAVRWRESAGAQIERVYELGKLNEYVSKRYLKDAANPTVYLASNELFSAIDKEAADLRDATPVKLETPTIQTLSIRPAKAEEVTLVQREGEWSIANPGPFAANQAAVEGVLREIRNLKATRFIDDAAGKLAEYGLHQPILTIESKPNDSAGNEPLLFSFGRVDAGASKKTD